jgi:hypothetical protein
MYAIIILKLLIMIRSPSHVKTLRDSPSSDDRWCVKELHFWAVKLVIQNEKWIQKGELTFIKDIDRSNQPSCINLHSLDSIVMLFLEAQCHFHVIVSWRQTRHMISRLRGLRSRACHIKKLCMKMLYSVQQPKTMYVYIGCLYAYESSIQEEMRWCTWVNHVHHMSSQDDEWRPISSELSEIFLIEWSLYSFVIAVLYEHHFYSVTGGEIVMN